MRKRILSILLCLVMVVALFPTMAFAVVDESDNIISRAGATIAAPVGGETPSFTATSEDPSKYSVKVYNWIDLERNMDIKAYELADPDNYYYNYTFEAGKEYAVVIGFNEEIENGPQLSKSTQFFINGNQSTRSYGHFRARRYDFTATGSGGGTVTPTYTATVDSIDLGSVKLGYTQPDYKNLTITNTGNFPLSVNVDSVKFITGSEYFQLATFNNQVSNIPVGGQCTSWSVCPKANLSIGTYTATVQFQDSKGEMSAPATATVTFKVEDHDYDTTKWEYDANFHWNPCKDSGCNAKGNIAEHDRNKEVGGYDATFDADGKTPDLYCSVCNRKMQSGKAIAAGKYIRESKATMTPGIDNTISANDLVFTSLDTSKYTVGLRRVLDMTDPTLNTIGSTYKQYPHDKKFISGHEYAIEFAFEAVKPYEYDAMHDTHSSTFKLNDADTMMSVATTLTGSPSRRVELVAGEAGVATSVSGTVLSWNDKNDALYYLYPYTKEDADIKAEWKSDKYTGTACTSKGTPTASDKQFEQSFTFDTVAAGDYKLVIFKPDMYVPKIVPITVGTTDYTCGQLKLWLYGDVNYDGKVSIIDAVQIQMYKAGKTSVFTDGSGQDIADRMVAANVTEVTVGDTIVNVLDAVQIQLYKAGKSSAFNSMK